MTWSTYRGVSVEHVHPSGFHRAYVDPRPIMADDLDGALAEIDKQQGPHRLTVMLEIAVEPDDWMDAHGTTTRKTVAEDVRQALPDRIRHLVGQGFRASEGVTVTGIAAVHREDDASSDDSR